MARKLQWMGAGWAGMGGGSTNGIYPVHLSDGCGLVSERVGQRKLLDVVSGKRKVSKVSPGMGW